MSNKTTTSPAAKILNLLLLLSFVVTILAPLTGLIVHKLASALFLLLCIVHTLLYRKRLKVRSLALLALVFLAFFTGLFSLIFDEIPLILALHKVISIGSVFVLAIHIFIFHRHLLRS
ncbi:MAG: heme transporter CcmB [Oscillospiraceae bacterium]|nr:heme transporter CcmB [Oscillospiraceae bacterium]